MSNKRVNSDLLSTLILMIKVRMVEEAIANSYHLGKMRCPTHLSIGQEAVPSVLSSFLNDKDLAVSTHRGHAHYIAKGGSIPEMLAEIYGKATGCSSGKGGSMHLIDKSVGFMGTSAIVGNSIPIGVGLAMGLKLMASDRIAVIYLGDGATEEGVFYESLNFAAVRELPVLFVCENNLYSVYSSLSCRQPKEREIFKVAQSMGVESFKLDGNNPISLTEKLGSIIDNIRTTSRPSFIECDTYRLREHCGPNFDDELKYRDEKEVEIWKAKDPISSLVSDLGLTQADIKRIKEGISLEINEAFDFADASPFPDASEAFTGEFATL
jgi:TPP-dependent pyruvate/acetoin dehydrogenase alpha subunit